MTHKVHSLIIYPIKGMKGSKVKSAKALERGFENDRRYMLIDKNNKFVSQRSHSLLTQVVPTIIKDEIVVSYLEETFYFPMSLGTTEVVNITLFDNVVQGTLVSSELDKQFSRILNEKVRLVKMSKTDVRTKRLVKGPDSTEVSFADGYPYLIVGTQSLITLNSKLDIPISMDRFRPNIVIESSVAHIEDSWEKIEIGSCEFMVIKPCARCPVVTIDQQTGNRSKEPLSTLANYRKIGNLVYFGVNTISLSGGEISIGDALVTL